MNRLTKENLTEYADYLLKTALYKAGNIHDAEDLAQDTLLAALVYLDSGKTVENPKGWLSSVLDHRFYDSIRRKYRKPTVSMDVVAELAEEMRLYENAEKTEEAENIRRCIAMLGRNYRDVIVRHYLNGESVRDIAKTLGIPENTVKSRLYTGRSHIRKELEMEKYAKQSYQPETLWIGCTGQTGINDEPYSLVQNDKIKMNLLILAYEKPLTIPELAGAIGIPAAYVEPIVDGLVKGELMVRSGDKVYTDFIIYTEKDRLEYLDRQLKIAEENYRKIWEIVEKGLDELRRQDFYQEQRTSARHKLESHFVIRTVQTSVNNVRSEVYGGDEPFSEYRRRPNGGKWYAIGNLYPESYENAKSRHLPYGINGEWGSGIEDFLDTRYLTLTEYDTVLCHAHALYNIKSGKESVIKMLYSLCCGNGDAFAATDKSCIDNIGKFIEAGFLSRDSSGKLICEVPVISAEERERHYGLTKKYSSEISEKFHDAFISLMDKPLTIPSHVKSYLKWQRYMLCCEYLPMAIVLAAKEEGLYSNTEAAVYMSYEK